MNIETLLGIIFASILLGPLLLTILYVLFKKDEGEQYCSAYLIWLKIKIFFTFNKAKRQALKDEHWVKSNKEEKLIENYNNTKDLSISYTENDDITHIIKHQKEIKKKKEAKKTASKKTTKKATTKKTVKKTTAKKTTKK